jgi:hypothetical protein
MAPEVFGGYQAPAAGFLFTVPTHELSPALHIV